MSEIKKFESYVRIVNVLTLVSLILSFLITLLNSFILFINILIHLNTGFKLRQLYFYLSFIIIFVSAWVGIGLIIISKRKIKREYTHISSSIKKYMIGTGLMILSFGTFIAYILPYISLFYILISIIPIVAISGFLISWFFLKKAKLIYNENTELFLEKKKIEETKKLTTLYCPRCKTKVEGDSNSCDLCNQDFNEFPAITREEKSFRYCPRCQKNVKPKKKFSAGYWIVIIIIGFVLFNLTGLFGIIATIGLLLVTAIHSPRCSNCKKKTESPRFLQPSPIPQIQEQESNPQ